MNNYELQIDEQDRLPDDATNVRTRRLPDGDKVVRFHSDTGPTDGDEQHDDVQAENDSDDEVDPITGQRRRTPWGGN